MSFRLHQKVIINCPSDHRHGIKGVIISVNYLGPNTHRVKLIDGEFATADVKYLLPAYEWEDL